MEIGDLITHFGADLSDLQRAAARAEALMKEYENQTQVKLKQSQTHWSRYGLMVQAVNTKIKASVAMVKSAILSTQMALISLGGTVVLGMLGRQFISAASEAEGFRLRLDALLRSSEEGGKTFKAMADYAGKVSFQYRDVMASATALSGIVKGGTEDIKKWMPFIGDLAAAAGLNLETTTSQVIKMFSAGASAADTFRERGILSMLGFTSGVKYTAEETKKIMWDAWNATDSKFKDLSAKLATTWEGITSMMADKWFQFRVTLMDSGAFDFIKGAMQAIINRMNDLQKTGRFDAFAKDMGEKITSGMKGILLGSAMVADSFRGWEIIWEGLKMTFGGLMFVVSTGVETLSKLINMVVGNWADKVVYTAELIAKAERAMGRYDTAAMFDEIGTFFKGFGEGLDKIQAEAGLAAQAGKDLVAESIKNLNVLIDQVSNYEKAKNLILEIEAAAAAIGKNDAAMPDIKPFNYGDKPNNIQDFWKQEGITPTEMYDPVTLPGKDMGSGFSNDEQLNSFLDKQMALDEVRLEAFTVTESMEQAHQDRMVRLQQQGSDSILQIEQYQNRMAVAGKQQFFNNLSSLMNTSNKKLFEIGKVAAIASATMQGHQAVMAAYAAGMMPPGGPGRAAAYALIAGIAAANMIANIASSSFGGGGGPGASIGQGSSGYTNNEYFAQPTGANNTNAVLLELADVLKVIRGIPPGQVVTIGMAQAGGAVAVMGNAGVSELAQEITGSVYK